MAHSLTFLQALALSDALAARSEGGPWALLVADAEQSVGGFNGTPAPDHPQNCTPSAAVPGVPADSTVILASGVARLWGFFYLGANGSDLWNIVLDGQASLAELDAASEHCVPSQFFAHLNESQLRDSPDVVAALGNNWTRYAATHTVLASRMFLATTGYWSLVATACPYQGNDTATFPTGPDYEGTVNATSLAVLADQAFGPSTCTTAPIQLAR